MDPQPRHGRPPGITTSGTGRAARRPDRAEVLLLAEVTAAAAADAQGEASARMSRIIDSARGHGVAEPDLVTRSVSLDPVYDHAGHEPRLTGYRASQALAVAVRDLDALGPLIDAAVAAGATGVGSVSLGITDPTEAEAEARTAAMADARARAEALASAGAVRLGRLVSVRELPAVGDGPMPMFRMAAEAAMAGTPVAAGSAEVVVGVEATWSIEDAPPS